MGLRIPTEPYQKQQDNDTAVLHNKLHRIGTHIDVKKGADLSSGSTVTFGNDGWFFDITGTTTITRFEFRQAGEVVFLQFNAALQLTHNATNLILNQDTDITTQAGDLLGFISLGGSVGSGNWKQMFAGGTTGLGAKIMAVLDFWSEIDDIVTITTTAANQALPSIVVADIPAGLTVDRAMLMLKFRFVEDTSGSINSLVLAGTEHIQIDKTGGTYIDGIKLIASMALVAANSSGGGDVWFGDIDVSGEVDGNDTYEVRWEGADCIGNNLIFRDLQVGLRVWFR